MKRLLFVLIVLSVISGCASDDGKPLLVGEVCIKGVKYYHGPYHLSPAMKLNGTLHKCD